jgi:DNA-binding IclR family transcriptional regulator
MKRTSGPLREKIIDLFGLLVRAPRTVAELADLTGMDRTTIYPWLHLMMEEGLLRRESVGRINKHYVYFWVFAQEEKKG